MNDEATTAPTVYDVVAEWFNGDTGPWDLPVMLGIDPGMSVAQLRRRLACSCPIQTTAVYRDSPESL